MRRPSKKPLRAAAKSSGRRSVRHRPLRVEWLEPRRLLSAVPQFSQAVVFGDSLSDTGNDSAFASLLGYKTSNGRFTSDPTSKPPSAGTGVWHEVLETELGIARATPSSKGGSNWAYGAATTGSGTQDFGIVHNVGQQVSDYLSSTHNVASSTALYMFWAGANDLLDAADNLTGTVSVHALESAANTAAANLENDIKQFAADGAKYVLWPNLPALDQTPDARSSYSATVEAALADAVLTFNNDLASAIQSIHSAYPSEVVYSLDVYTPFNEMLEHTYPAYNFSDVTDAASSVTPVPASADTYLFWDKLHPTEEAHKLLGDTAYNLIASSPSVSKWSGGGANANWSTPANWGGAALAANDYVEFVAAAGASTTNDLAAGTQFDNVTFDAGAGAFTLNGNAVNLAGNVTNNSASKETINLPLVLTGNRTLDAAAGGLTIAGNIGQTGGSYGITKTGPGTVTLSGVNTYTGGTLVSAGTVVVTSPSALPSGSAVTVGASGAFESIAPAIDLNSAGVVASTTFVAKPALPGPSTPAVHNKAILAVAGQKRAVSLAWLMDWPGGSGSGGQDEIKRRAIEAMDAVLAEYGQQ